MFDAKRILDQFLGGQGAAPGTPAGGASGNAGGLLGGALAGGLVGLLAGTKTGRKFGKAALTYGGTALVGGLAYKAWSDWRAGRGVAPVPGGGEAPPLQPPPAGSAFLPAAGRDNDLNRSLVRAMISAAKADGHIDAEEQQRIFRAVNEMGLSTEEKAFVMDELGRPADAAAVAAGAFSPEVAAEIYLASLLAIDPSGPAERAYLGQLAAHLGLEAGLVEHLHANAQQVAA